jgi:hypothetical protein
MSDARWQRVNDLFHAALERDAESRDPFLREACGADDALYADVVSLIDGRCGPARDRSERLGAHAAGGLGRRRAARAARRPARRSVSGRRPPWIRRHG